MVLTHIQPMGEVCAIYSTVLSGPQGANCLHCINLCLEKVGARRLFTQPAEMLLCCC